MKPRYDYGLVVFILTFCLISVSGYREDEVLSMAHRLTTIAIGGCTSVIVCIFICPVWIGEDLHNHVADNLEKLGNFLEGFGGEYFKVSKGGQSNNDKSFLQGYKSVLNSKNSEETMAKLTRWEPGHGCFKFRNPWKHYLKVGTLTRECAYKVDALSSYLNSEKHIPWPAEIQSKVQESSTMLSSESGRALKVLASAIKTMTLSSSSVNSHIAKAKAAIETLKSLFKISYWTKEDTDLLEIVQAAMVASLLLDVVTCTEKIAASVNDLASHANFESPNNDTTRANPRSLHQGTVQQISGNEEPLHVITIDEYAKLKSLGETN